MLPDWATWCWRMRSGLRMTQVEAAGVAGVSVRTWRRWEGYESEPAEWRKDRARDAFTLEAVTAMAAPRRAGRG